MCTSAHYLNNIPLVVFTDTLYTITNMAYDLAVGKSNLIKDNPTIVGGLEFDDQNILINKLNKKYPSTIFRLLSNPFEDITIQTEQLIESKNELFQIIVKPDLEEEEINMVYKLIAIICFAINSGFPLHGIAD